MKKNESQKNTVVKNWIQFQFFFQNLNESTLMWLEICLLVVVLFVCVNLTYFLCRYMGGGKGGIQKSVLFSSIYDRQILNHRLERSQGHHSGWNLIKSSFFYVSTFISEFAVEKCSDFSHLRRRGGGGWYIYGMKSIEKLVFSFTMFWTFSMAWWLSCCLFRVFGRSELASRWRCGRILKKTYHLS